MSQREFRAGDLVIYHKTKYSSRPGPRAQYVDPAPKGDQYTYMVDKYWIVAELRDSTLVVRTRRGKQHAIAASDHNLRHARWWERLLFRHRFPTLDAMEPNLPDSQMAASKSI